MDKYEIVKTIGSGSQGHVFQVRHKQTNKFYVLKKIQCMDEKQANKALDEAKALMQLRHPNICIHRDHFLKWDPQMKTFDVCIIMDCYPDGDLRRLLSMKRNAKSNIEDIIVKKWLAQFVDFLVYIHDKKFIHRDLKPDNIFVSEALDLVVGDFGVVALDNELCARTRAVVGTPAWMAPEAFTGSTYDARCDVWSFGCVLAEMLTCKHFSNAEMPEKLTGLRSKDTDLELVLSHIAEDYSKSMSDLVRRLLQRDPNHRPFSRDLKNVPLVKECLKLLPTSTQEAKTELTVTGGNTGVALPTDKGPAGVLAFLQQRQGDEAATAAALAWLAAREDLKLDNAGERTVGAAMREHLLSEAVCGPAAAIFAAATRRIRKTSSLHTSAIVKPMLEAAKNHPSVLAIQLASATYQANVSGYEGGPQLLAAHGGLEVLLAALREFPGDHALVTAASEALCGLFSETENARIGAQSGAIDLLCRCWAAHKARPAVLAAVASALLGLSSEAAILDSAEQFQLPQCLACALAEFPVHKDFARFGLLLLGSLAEDEQLAITFLTMKNVPEGIPQLARVLAKHQSVLEVVEPLILVLANITSHEPQLTPKQASEIKSMTQAILKQFASKQEVKNACDQVMTSLAKC